MELTKVVRRTVESAMNARVEVEDNQELALQNMKLRSQLATKRFIFVYYYSFLTLYSFLILSNFIFLLIID